MLKKAWDNVTETTIINCFHKAQFIIDDGPPDDPPIEELEDHTVFIDDNLPICDDNVNENDDVKDDFLTMM